jgi:ketosteroid isomerase-like protein
MDKAMFAKQAKAQAGAKSPSFDGRSDIEEIVVCGDWAFTRSHLQMTLTANDGTPAASRTGYAMTVFRRQGNGWLLARDANLLAR